MKEINKVQPWGRREERGDMNQFWNV